MSTKAIESLRAYLAKEDYAAMIIPSSDPHFGEYIPDHYKCIKWLCGFSGEAATLVVTAQRAALWADSRFWIAATKELEGTGVELMKIKADGTPSVEDWLKSLLGEDDIVAIDEDLFTYGEYQAYVDALSPVTPALVEDPFDDIWEDRPPLEFNEIRLMPESVAGESVNLKIERLSAVLQDSLPAEIRSDVPFMYVVTMLDDIAWLSNLRGCDVAYTPLFVSYAVVSEGLLHLFLRRQLLSSEAMSYLCTQNVRVHDYEEFDSFLHKLPQKMVRMFSGNRITAKYFFRAMENTYNPPVFRPICPDPVTGGAVAAMKAVKNETEIAGFRKAYAEDAMALNALFKWIRENVNEGITEWDVAVKLQELRAVCPDYQGESFPPIVAYGPNAALPHYETSPVGSAVIRPDGFLLIDTGGQYSYGTTDTTRTLVLGPITDNMRDDYTYVLKGMIDMAMASFFKGMRGCLLDIYARGPIIAAGKLYRHGTCHGIGHNLCVHEGPQSIRMEENPVLLDGNMVMSDEPAIYVEGHYGVRHENTILSVPFVKNEFGEFFRFETLTRVRIETDAVNWSLLTGPERKWLEEFNAQCL